MPFIELFNRVKNLVLEICDFRHKTSRQSHLPLTTPRGRGFLELLKRANPRASPFFNAPSLRGRCPHKGVTDEPTRLYLQPEYKNHRNLLEQQAGELWPSV